MAGGVVLVTWNLRGRARPDLGEVARRLAAQGAEVAALQEVQRAQAEALSADLGWARPFWSFKHFPLVAPAEGLAVLARHPLTEARALVLSQGEPRWSHHRRIAQLVGLEARGRPLRLANVHLGTGPGAERMAQARRLAGAVAPGTVVVGDLNERPGGPAVGHLLGAGLRDAWPERAGGATNWSAGRPAGAPTQRLDYVLVPAGWTVLDARVPGEADLDDYRRLSDHLPVAVRLSWDPGPRGGDQAVTKR